MINETLQALQTLQANEAVITSEDRDWDLVVSCLHYEGSLYRALPVPIVRQAWSLADGFGRVTIKYIEETLEWDWSHIRDSSPVAIKAMAACLRGHVPNVYGY